MYKVCVQFSPSAARPALRMTAENSNLIMRLTSFFFLSLSMFSEMRHLQGLEFPHQ